MASNLNYTRLVELVDNVLNPKERGFTSEEINRQLLLFCMNCPDPAAAMDVVVETPHPTTARELVDRCLSFPYRDISSISLSEMAASHPIRHMISQYVA